MKTITIYAYTRLNLGDDLFIKILCEKYPTHKFILMCPKKYATPFKHIVNLKCYSLDSFPSRIINFIFRKLNNEKCIQSYYKNKSNASVTIGGSIFMQNNDWELGIKEFSKRLEKNKPAYILGCNFGPYTDIEYIEEHKKLFSQFTDVCFRDQFSYNLFKDLDNVRIAPDIVFKLEDKENRVHNNTLVISVIKPSVRKNLYEYDDIYYLKMRNICIKAIEHGLNVKLMSFCKDEGDEEAIESILNILPNKYSSNISKYLYNGNIEEALDIIKSSKAIIATRFHSMILGYAYNKPTFPIIYSNKMKNVINDINSNIKYIELKNISDLSCDEVIKYLENEYIDIGKLCEQSENHFKKLDEYLLK